VVAYAWGVPNPQNAAYVAIATGVALTIYLRPDLAWNTIYGALSFGLVYFVCLKVWTILFPGVQGWFTFQGLPKLFIWDVPGWEAMFGFFFGAFWGSLYEVLFGYRLVQLKRKASKMVRHCDVRWNQLLCSSLVMVEKLEKLGFTYCNEKVVVIEIVEGKRK